MKPWRAAEKIRAMRRRKKDKRHYREAAETRRLKHHHLQRLDEARREGMLPWIP